MCLYCPVPTSLPEIEGTHLQAVKAGERQNLTCTVSQSYPQADITWVDQSGLSLHSDPTIHFSVKTYKSGISSLN